MNELIEFLTSKEIIVVYIVAVVACLLCFIIYLVDKNYYKRKQRHNTKELNKLVEEVTEIVEDKKTDISIETYETPVLSPVVEEYVTQKETNVDSAVLTSKEINNLPEEAEITNDGKEDKEIVYTELLEEPAPEINVEDLVLSTMTDTTASAEYNEEPEILSVEEVISDTTTPEVTSIQEELEYTSIEPDRQQAQEELMRLTEELEKAEQEAKTIDLTSYEEEQEENAIISLDELMKKSKEMYTSNEITQYADEGNEPISIEDLERRMQAVKEDITTITTPVENHEQSASSIVEELEPVKVTLADFNTIKVTEPVEQTIDEQPTSITVESVKPLSESYQNTRKFERTPVISPIYGIEKTETAENIALENTANYDKLDEEIKKTNEFLMTLRELQKNLD